MKSVFHLLTAGIIALCCRPFFCAAGPLTQNAPGAEQRNAGVRPAATSTGGPDILVSIVMHVEEDPDFYNNSSLFFTHRASLLSFANTLHSKGVMFNYQSDWNFYKAVKRWDTGAPGTSGKNIVRYMKENLGFEIDPHAHESTYNYADVAFLISDLGVPPSHTAGGMIVSPAEDSILEQFWSPIVGWIYPSYSWQAEILWGGGTRGHVNEEALWGSGVWRPQDKEHFTQHDDSAPLPNVGKYESTWSGLDRLVQLRDNCQLSPGIYTCTVFLEQMDLRTPGFVAAFQAQLDSHKLLPGLRWVGLKQVIDIWNSEYGHVANQWFWLQGDGQVAPDLDGDGDVDMSDVERFQACRTGPNIPYAGSLPAECTLVPNCAGILPADLDADGDTDLSDFGIVQRCLSDPGVAYDPTCVE